MDTRIFQWAFRQNTGSAAGKLMLLVIARHTDPSNTATMSLQGLCTLTELTRVSVIKWLQILEDKELIHIKHKRGKGSTTSFVITMLPDAGFDRIKNSQILMTKVG